MGLLVLGRALEQAGMSLDDVVVIPKDQSNMARTYDSGEVDAVVTYPPYSVGLDRTGHIIFDSTRIPGEVVDIVAVDADKLNPEVAARIQGVWKRILDDVEANRDESYGTMAKREKISLQEFQTTMNGIQMVSVKQQKVLLESGRLRTTVLNLSRFLREAGVLKSASDSVDILAPAQQLLSVQR
jgi:NitT/TauT family transport system substrate-binding protein